MKIPKNYDAVARGPVDFEKGTGPFDNPGIKPVKNVADTPGEKAMNEPGANTISKKQPFGKGGSGYTSD